MAVPEGLRCTKTHEWVRVSEGVATIGITDHAASEMQDLVFIELPEAGREVARGDVFGELESVKAVSELYAPVSGEVVESNGELVDNLDAVSDAPYEEGWMVKIRLTKPEELEELLSAGQYATYLASSGGY